MVELVDTPDLKSCALWGVRVQVPLRVLKPSQNEKAFFILKYLQRGFHPEFVELPNFRKLGFFAYYLYQPKSDNKLMRSITVRHPLRMTTNAISNSLSHQYSLLILFNSFKSCFGLLCLRKMN